MIDVRISSKMGCEVQLAAWSSTDVELRLIERPTEDVTTQLFSRLGPVEARTLAHALLSWCEERDRG